MAVQRKNEKQFSCVEKALSPLFKCGWKFQKPAANEKTSKTNGSFERGENKCKLQIAKALMLIKHTHSTGANDSENLEFPANFSAQRFSVFRFGSIIM